MQTVLPACNRKVLAIILIFGFLIFGPDRLPAMGRTIGRALRQFRQAQDQMNKMVQSEIVNPLNESMKEPAKKQGPKKKVTGAAASAKPETFAEKKARLAAEADAAAKRKAAGDEAPAAETPAAAGTAAAKPASTVKKSGSSAAKLYGIDKDRIAAARAAAAAQKAEKEEQADA